MISPLSQIRTRLRMRHLQLLFALSEEGSLRKAAEVMAMTQPAATKALHELEALVGEALFVRSPRGLVPNMLGEAAIRYAHLVFADMGIFHAEMKALQSGDLGSIRIGAMGSLTAGLLPKTIARLKEQHPRLNINIMIDTSDILLQALNRDQLDLLVARIPQGYPSDDLHFEPFDEELIHVVARADHPQKRQATVSLAALADYPWVIQAQPTPLREIYNQIFREAQLAVPKSTVETASTMLTASLLQHTDMVSLMPVSLLDYYRQLGILTHLPVAPSIRLSSYGLIYRQSRGATPSIQIVGAALCEQARLLRQPARPPAAPARP